jgi:hypothetical protein
VLQLVIDELYVNGYFDFIKAIQFQISIFISESLLEDFVPLFTDLIPL